jgi:hypothetical protein
MFLCFYVFRSRACGQGLRSVAQLSLELFTGSVFSVSIGWYFLGILPTNNSVGTFRYQKIGPAGMNRY